MVRKVIRQAFDKNTTQVLQEYHSGPTSMSLYCPQKMICRVVAAVVAMVVVMVVMLRKSPHFITIRSPLSRIQVSSAFGLVE